MVDLAKEVDFLAMGKEEREAWFCDHLHYNERGYDRLGELVFEAIRPHL